MLTLEFQIKVRKQIELAELIQDGRVDEDDLVDAIERRDYSTIENMLRGSTIYSSTEFYHEIMNELEGVNPEDGTVKIKFNNMEILTT